MKQILLPLLGVIIFITVVGLLTRNVQNNSFSIFPTINTSSNPPSKPAIKVKDVEILVDIADTEEKRQKGLSGKNDLKENEGMLFVFNGKNTRPSFWMKNMLIPIDIIWIKDGKIVKIDKQVSPPDADTPDSKLTVYMPPSPIDHVLEVNAGFSEKFNVATGDPVDLSSL